MDIEKLIDTLKQHGVSCVRSYGKYCSICDEAATALSMLQAENKRLNKIVCSIPTTPDSGRTVSQYDKEMSMCVYLGDLEAENEKLWGELEYEKERTNAYYEECGQWEAENEKLRAELEQVKRALAMMWYAYDNKDGEFPHEYEIEAMQEAENVLGPWAECMPKYLQRGPQKED